MVRTRPLRLFLGCALAVSLSAGAAGCSGGSASGSTGGAPGLPPASDPVLDAGRQIIETKCKMCHTLDRVRKATHDSVAWEKTIARMRQHGLVASDQEVQQVLDYLASR